MSPSRGKGSRHEALETALCWRVGVSPVTPRWLSPGETSEYVTGLVARLLCEDVAGTALPWSRLLGSISNVTEWCEYAAIRGPCSWLNLVSDIL